MSAIATDVGEMIAAVYVSSAVRPFNDDEILEILRAARKNNERLGVTGMLLYRDGNFLQILEGPESVVRQLVSVIERDERHRHFMVLTVKPIFERHFADWSMAFRDISALAFEEPGYSPFLEPGFEDNLFRTRPELAYKLLLRFKQDMR